MTLTTTATRLDHVRKHLKLSHRKFGAPIGVSESGVRKFLERDNVRDIYLDIFQKEFGINKQWVLSGEGEMLISADEGVVNEPSSKYGVSGNYDHEEAIRMHKLLKEYIPESMMDVWEKQLQELVDLCEYKELYIKAKEYYVGKKK